METMKVNICSVLAEGWAGTVAWTPGVGSPSHPPHFTEEGADAQRGGINYLKSHSTPWPSFSPTYHFHCISSRQVLKHL